MKVFLLILSVTFFNVFSCGSQIVSISERVESGNPQLVWSISNIATKGNFNYVSLFNGLHDSVNHEFVFTLSENNGTILEAKTVILNDDRQVYIKNVTCPDSSCFFTGNLASPLEENIVFGKFNENGSLLWLKELEIQGAEDVSDMVYSQDGRIFLIGKRKPPNTGGNGKNGLIVACDFSGNVSWLRQYDQGFSDVLTGAALGDTTNLWVCGFSKDSTGVQQGTLMEVDPYTGILLKSFATVGGNDKRFYTIDFDNAMNLLVSGCALEQENGTFVKRSIFTSCKQDGTINWSQKIVDSDMNQVPKHAWVKDSWCCLVNRTQLNGVDAPARIYAMDSNGTILKRSEVIDSLATSFAGGFKSECGVQFALKRKEDSLSLSENTMYRWSDTTVNNFFMLKINASPVEYPLLLQEIAVINSLVSMTEENVPCLQLQAILNKDTLCSFDAPDSTLNVSNQQIKNSLKIFPNPANDYLYVKSTLPDVTIQVVTIDGRVLQSFEYIPERINVSKLESGTYFCAILSEGRSVAVPFIKIE